MTETPTRPHDRIYALGVERPLRIELLGTDMTFREAEELRLAFKVPVRTRVHIYERRDGKWTRL